MSSRRIKDVDISELLCASDSESDSESDSVGNVPDIYVSSEEDEEQQLEQRVGASPLTCKPTDLRWISHSEANNFTEPFPFTGTPGVKVEISNHEDPYELFKLFITDDLIARIVTETNLYAEQFLAFRTLQQHSRCLSKQTFMNCIFC